jgi:hypothetical protein
MLRVRAVQSRGGLDVSPQAKGISVTSNFTAPKINKTMKRELTTVDRGFISFCIQELEIQTSPKIRIGDDHSRAQEVRAMGYYRPKDNLIWVLRGKRVPADWYRTLAHELVHWRQRELGQEMDGSDGSELENEANSKAGVLLREFGRREAGIYVLDEEEDPKIPMGADLPIDPGPGGDLTGEPMVPYSI